MKKSFHFLTEQMVIWPLALPDKANFRIQPPLLFSSFILSGSLTYKLKTALSQGGFKIPHLIAAAFEYSESLSSLCP